jgi:hypothetical protein
MGLSERQRLRTACLKVPGRVVRACPRIDQDFSPLASSSRDLTTASSALERKRNPGTDLWRFGDVFRLVADARQDGDEPGFVARIDLSVAVMDASRTALVERLAEAPEPFWRHVRDALAACRGEKAALGQLDLETP